MREFPITVFAYCITSNHTHVLVRSESDTAVSQWMQQLEGEFAQSYNRRKHRSGAFWADRYHCTMIEEGPHLWNCMVYIDLNMVRAGVVAHPAQWPWCSYSEWMGQRRRYGVVDRKECLRVLGGASLAEFRANYDALIDTRLAKDVDGSRAAVDRKHRGGLASLCGGDRADGALIGSGSTIPRLGRVFGCCARISRRRSGKRLRSNNDRVKIVAKTIQRPLGRT